MNIAERVFQVMVKRWETRTPAITFFAKDSWHSFEEWLNWEAALGCKEDGLTVWPKAPYSHKDPHSPPANLIRFKETKQLSDLMVDTKDQRVVVEIALVHGNSESRMRSKLEGDRQKLDPTDCPKLNVDIFSLFIVVGVSHSLNPHKTCLPKWFTKWLVDTERVLGAPMKYSFQLPGGGVFEARGWRIRPQQHAAHQQHGMDASYTAVTTKDNSAKIEKGQGFGIAENI